MYGTEERGLKKSDIQSLDFGVNRFLMKLFKTANISVIQEGVAFSNFKLSSALLISRSKVFLLKYNNCDNLPYIYAYCFVEIQLRHTDT
jgi:hypothetical protein